MIIDVDEKFKKENTKDGSFLKAHRNIGGLGLGIITIGIFVIGIALLIALFASSLMKTSVLLYIIVIGAGIGILLIALGMKLQKNRVKNYRKYYTKKWGYSEEELESFDQEVASANTILISLHKRMSKTAGRECGIVTEQWLKLPGIFGEAIRIVDIAAVWFDKKPYYHNALLDPATFLVDSKGKVHLLLTAETIGNEYIEEIVKRNPRTISARQFTYNDKSYDGLKEPEKVAEIYRANFVQ